MFEKSVTTVIKDKFGVQAEVEAHRAEAAKTVPNPQLVVTHIGHADDDKEENAGNLTVTSVWKEGPEPQA